MRMIHVVPHVDQEAAGPSYTIPKLCEELSALGHDVTLSCLAARGDIPGVKVDLHPEWPVLSRFSVSPSHSAALFRNAAHVDIVHNHSLWSMVNVATGWVVPDRKAKLVTSPRGTLSSWALSRNRTLKSLLWPLQKRVLSRAALLHATSEAEYEEIRRAGFTAPVAVIPNGIDLPEVRIRPVLRGSGDGRTVLFLSRIHPTKGIERLLDAWARVEALHPGWNLVIAGTGDKEYVRDLQRRAAELNLRRASFPGPLYGEAKSKAYMHADLFVLPTFSENFGMVVAESLAHGCPAIVSQGAPWSGLRREKCGWWVDNSVDSLTRALDEAILTPSEELATMGQRGRIWMERDFGWKSLATRMQDAYAWILGKGPVPDWVKVN